MGRWDKQEQQSIQQQIRELVLSVNSRGLNEKSVGIIVPLRISIDTNRWYGNGKHRFVTGVYIDSEKSIRDSLIGNDTYLEQYTTDNNTIRIANNALYQLKGMIADNSLTMAKLYESPDHSTAKAFFCGCDAFYLDDETVAAQIKDCKVPSSIHRDMAVIDYRNTGDFDLILQNVLKTCREIGDRNIVLPMDDGRARILFNGSRVNLQPQDNINVSNDMGIEAMRVIAQNIDPDSQINVPEDGWIIKHPVEAVFSDRYLAKEFLLDYKNRYNLASIAVVDLLDYGIKNFNDTQKHWIDTHLLENGGNHPESRMVAAKNLLEYALCFAAPKSIERQNQVRHLLENLATNNGKFIKNIISKDHSENSSTRQSDIKSWKYVVDAVLTEREGIGQYLDHPETERIAKKLQERFGSIMQNPVKNLISAVKELKAQESIEDVNGEDYGIDSLYHAIRILEKTYGKVDGYQTDDGILSHECAITAVKNLYKQESVALKESLFEKKLSSAEDASNQKTYPIEDVVHVQEGEMAGEYVRIHGWTDEDPALLYSFSDASVYFYDTNTHKVENIENEDGIDVYRDREGFFMIKAEDYVRAYEQLEAHDNAVLEEIRAGHIVNLKNFLDYALPQVGHSLDFKNEDVRVKYISVSGEQSKEIKNLARVNGGFVMTGKVGYAVGIEHLTNGSAIRLLQQSREQLARDTIFARTTGPCNHFTEEELESLKHCTEDIQEPAKKQEFLMKALDGLAKQFKAERTSSEWIDDVREELQDLSKGVVRGEGLGRK